VNFLEAKVQKSSYRKLAEKLDMNFTGMPKRDGDFSPAFLEYLGLLYAPEEAHLASFVAVDPERSTAKQVAEQAGLPEQEVEQTLERLVEKRVLFGIGGLYVLPPATVLLNIHQFREDVDREALKASELYQDFFIHDGFFRFYQASAAGTLRRRTVPVEMSIAERQQVLSYETLPDFLDRANMGAMALVRCPCRSRTEKLGKRECRDKYPVGSCLVIGLPALLFIQRGEGRQISREDAGAFVEEMRQLGLVVLVDNAEEMTDGVICFCCGCCCSVTRGLTRWGNPKAFARSNFVARVGTDCVACGTCVEQCFFDALSIPDGADRAQVDEERCMGCGVCTVTCSNETIRLERCEREAIFPSTAELHARMAQENEAAGQKRRAAKSGG
jgi:Pyruvate/2-oxoacid:ferredoxin oxidoreductase delta subunit